jgi:hypothetical protein
MNVDSGKKGCDLKERCGFYCLFLHGEANPWRIMVEKYCEGTDYPLCARRIYFTKTGECAPLDMTPVGTLPRNILDDLLNKG